MTVMNTTTNSTETVILLLSNGDDTEINWHVFGFMLTLMLFAVCVGVVTIVTCCCLYKTDYRRMPQQQLHCKEEDGMDAAAL